MDLQRFPTIDPDQIGWVTEAEMVEIDRVMIEDLAIGLLQMMENAGRNLARLVIEVLEPQTVAVAAGSGGNGGGGMVAARHLANAGVDVTVATTRPDEELAGVPARQLDILRRLGVRVAPDLPPADVSIDAVIGYSLQGPPRGRSLGLIDRLVASEAPVVSLDTPSGLDVTTGEAPGAVVTADLTLTLALPKVGLRGAGPVGALFLGDISVPPAVTGRYGARSPDFRLSPILRLAS